MIIWLILVKIVHLKKQFRSARIQTVEESFNFGMQFTNTPLIKGAHKVSVNFDTKDMGEILLPRPAIQTNKVSGKDVAGTYSFIVDGKTSAEPSAAYEQVLAGTVSNTKVTAADTYVGSITPLTITPSENDFYLTQVVGTAKPTTYNKPTLAKIHDIEIDDTSSMASNIGSFGFNNSYYCFNPTTKKLMQTKVTAGKYDFEELTPKTLGP